jgi:hypothetical protein
MAETEVPPEPANSDEDDLPEPMKMPPWVPIAIALILIVMASLAIWTGLHYRDQPFAHQLTRTSSRAAQQVGPPGEPEPGASRIQHGQYGETVPSPNAMTDEASKVQISGGGATPLTQVIRLQASRGLLVDIVPEDAVVYVNNQAIGSAKQFSTADDLYEFADQGSFDVRISAPGYRDLQYVIASSPTASEEVAVIRAAMVKE